MIIATMLAVFNGVVVSTSRGLNGRLSEAVGPLQASLWNHTVGFGFLTVVLGAIGGWAFDPLALPPGAYLGGCLGALLVAVSSHAVSRLGAMHAALLLIGGQMTAALV